MEDSKTRASRPRAARKTPAAPRKTASAQPTQTQPQAPAALGAMPQAVAETARKIEGLGQHAMALGEGAMKSLQGFGQLNIPTDTLGRIQSDYLRQATELWNQSLTQGSGLKLDDRRFSSAEWTRNPLSGFVAANYLLNGKRPKPTGNQAYAACSTHRMGRARVRKGCQCHNRARCNRAARASTCRSSRTPASTPWCCRVSPTKSARSSSPSGR